MSHDAELLAVFVRFAERASEDFAIGEMLRDLAAAAARMLHVTGAGVAYREGDRISLVYASDAVVSDLERVQETLRQGPCQDALRTGLVAVATNLAAEAERWPEYVTLAQSLGIRAAAAVPLLARGRVWGTLDLYRADSGPFPLEDLDAAALLARVASGYVVLAADRDEARAAHRKSAHEATHDPLTGLPNRVLLHDRLTHALATARRRGSPLAVLFVDLDSFKAINDSFGHEIGDRMLVEAAARLTSVLRGGDTLARLGGDEFVIVCENLTVGAGGVVADDALAAVLGRIKASLARPAVIEGHRISLAASLGVATAAEGINDPDSLLRAADSAMYEAKRASAAATTAVPPNVIDLKQRDARRL